MRISSLPLFLIGVGAAPLSALAAPETGTDAGAPVNLVASPAESLESDPGPAVTDRVSLREALSRAQARSPTAAVAAAELRRAGALVEQARAASLPNLGFNLGDVYVDGARTYMGLVATPQNTFTGNLLLSVPLIAPPSWGRWAHAQNDEAVARWTEQDTRRQLSLAVAHAYLAVIVQQRVVDLNLRARATDQAHYEYTRQRQRGGLGTPLDELRARQQFESDASTVEAAQLGVERAQEALGVLLGEDHPVGITEEPPFEVPDSREAAPDAAVGRAAELRPDIKGLQGKVQAARQVVHDDWLDYLPLVNAAFEPAYQQPASAFQPQWSWEFLFTLTFPIYDGGLRYGLAHERAALLVEADRNLEGTLRQAHSDVRVGFRAVTRNDSALRDALAAAASAHQAVDVANLQYKAGATTNIDVIDAERRAHDADTAAAEAADGARQARLDLLSAMGRFP